MNLNLISVFLLQWNVHTQIHTKTLSTFGPGFIKYIWTERCHLFVYLDKGSLVALATSQLEENKKFFRTIWICWCQVNAYPSPFTEPCSLKHLCKFAFFIRVCVQVCIQATKLMSGWIQHILGASPIMICHLLSFLLSERIFLPSLLRRSFCFRSEHNN